MTMSDELFETIREMQTWKRENPVWYSGKEFDRRYNATIKVMRAFARYIIAGEKKGKTQWNQGMRGFKYKW